MANASICYKHYLYKDKKGGNYLGFIDRYLNLNFYIRILAFFLLIMEFLEVLKDCLNFVEFLRLVKSKFVDFLFLRSGFGIRC